MVTNYRTVLIISLTLISIAIGQDYRLNFEYANRLYLEKKYDEAYQKYEQILESGYESGELYYNLGNTAYRLKKKGEAVLFYEKALKYIPEDPDVKYNLNLLQMQVVDRLELPEKPFYLEWFDYLKQSVSVPGSEFLVNWGILFLSALWAAWIYFRKKEYANIILSGTLILTFLWLAYFGFWNLGNYDKELVKRAVLLNERVEIKAEPNFSGETLFILHEGATFSVKRSSPEWAEIELLDGKKGWIPKRMIGEI